MEATLEKVEKAIFAVMVFPFYLALRFSNLAFLATFGTGIAVSHFGQRRLALAFFVAAIVVTSLALGASLERYSRRR